MKRLIYFLFLSFTLLSETFAQGTIQQAQVVGLIPALKSKQNALTLGNFTTTTGGLTIGNGTGSVIGSGISLDISYASTTSSGLLYQNDFNIFNNKVSFPGFGITTGKSWGYDSHPTTISGYGIIDTPWTSYLPLSGGTITGTINTQKYSSSIPSPTNTAQYFLGAALSNTNYSGQYFSGATSHDWFVGMFPDAISGSSDAYGMATVAAGTITPKLIFNNAGAATFTSTVNSTGFLLNGNNLTSALSTNYIPKWNGASFVNSLTSDDGGGLILPVNKDYYLGSRTSGSYGIGAYYNGTNYIIYDGQEGSTRLSMERTTGNVNITSTTPTTSSTTGALVVSGGEAIGGDLYVDGDISTPGTVTTGDLTAALTVSAGQVVNIGLNSTTISGSTSGSAVFNQPFSGAGYKKAIVIFTSLNGTATYTFPTPFAHTPVVTASAVSAGAAGVTTSTTQMTITGSSSAIGIGIIEGY